ncbi:MAG: hypothetical protein ACLR7Z_17650 [Bilophila wadsworthia]
MSAASRRCVEGFADCRHIITGCSGCTLQLASAAPSGVTVRLARCGGYFRYNTLFLFVFRYMVQPLPPLGKRR